MTVVDTVPARADAAAREVDAIFGRAFERAPAPGIAYGLIADGKLVHSRGPGALRARDQRSPDADIAFRIASMTKSYAAGAILQLRDERRLALDEPVATYVPDLAGLRGPTRDSPPVTEPARGDTPAHREWWMVGGHGCVRIEILVSPEPEPKVQTFDVTSVPEPRVELTSAAEAIVGAFAEAAAGWPAAVRLGPKVDHVIAERELRAAAVRYGAARLGRCMAGDGERKATWRVSTDRGELELRIERDPATGDLTAFALRPKAIKAPFLADG